MAEKVKMILKSNMFVCVLLIVLISLTTAMFASDFRIKAGAMEEGVVFGQWYVVDSNGDNLRESAVYQATSDGFVMVSNIVPNSYGSIAETEPINKYDDMTRIVSPGGFIMPVKKGQYWRIHQFWDIRWMPIGNGSAPVFIKT